MYDYLAGDRVRPYEIVASSVILIHKKKKYFIKSVLDLHKGIKAFLDKIIIMNVTFEKLLNFKIKKEVKR